MDYLNFGKLRKAYELGRQAYPPQVRDYVFSLIGTSRKVLDVGCGTGIATRQLAERIKDVSGCDIDDKMIETAREYKDSIQYFIAPAGKMPFGSGTFEAVTSFGAFHWFCDNVSVSEIRRVLKKGGFFIVVNKNEADDFMKNYENIVRKITGSKPPPSVKTTYKPITILSKNNFSNVTAKEFPHVEEFTIPRALEQIKSMILWNLIPKEKKLEALEIFRSHFEKSAQEGVIRRQLNIVVVSGKK